MVKNTNNLTLTSIKSFKKRIINVGDCSRLLKKANIRPCGKTVVCYTQDWNVFLRAERMCHGCGWSSKTVDYLAKRPKKILGKDMSRHSNEGINFAQLLFKNIYNFKSLKQIKSDSVPEILDNEYAKIRMDIMDKNVCTINENEKLNLEEGGEVVNTVEKNI
ncbi:hypothetical protein CWI36_0473p0020 [Hamiltosporidium magnivora]|uniref:Uncharacterized protein n=1 Tax=Hamiltosporidium magnivora TaxID=148818 RepID=A0A4Q9LH64_9MICR|nr:hypothetical protein CWI36_0473p0020 [Hamiltosporidium magnivora]